MGQYRVRDITEIWTESAIDNQVKFQLISWLFLGLIAIYLAARGRADFRLVSRGPILWFTLYAALGFVSTAYSAAPGMSFFAASQFLIACVLVVCLREKLVDLHVFVLTYVGVNWLLVMLRRFGLDFGIYWIQQSTFYSEEVGGAARFSSSLGHPMSIGFVAALGAIWLCIRLPFKKRYVNVMIIGWLVLTVILTVSRTAMIGLAGGLILVALSRRAFAAALISLGTVLPLVLLVSQGTATRSVAFVSRGQSGDELRSMTGRSLIFDAAIKRGSESMFLGEGFRAARKEGFIEGAATLHAHNAFLEAFVGLGVGGLILAIGMLVSLAMYCMRLIPRGRLTMPWGSFSGLEGLALFFPIFVYSFLTSGVTGIFRPLVVFFLIVSALIEAVVLKLPYVVGQPSARPDDGSRA
jgi:hypothetical protein